LSEALEADNGFNVESRAIRSLIEVMSEYDAPTRREYLQFLTESPKFPIGGFRGLNPLLTVVRKPHEAPLTADDYLPSVMICVIYLKLPEYTSKEVMRSRGTHSKGVPQGLGGPVVYSHRTHRDIVLDGDQFYWDFKRVPDVFLKFWCFSENKRREATMHKVLRAFPLQDVRVLDFFLLGCGWRVSRWAELFGARSVMQHLRVSRVPYPRVGAAGICVGRRRRSAKLYLCNADFELRDMDSQSTNYEGHQISMHQLRATRADARAGGSLLARSGWSQRMKPGNQVVMQSEGFNHQMRTEGYQRRSSNLSRRIGISWSTFRGAVTENVLSNVGGPVSNLKEQPPPASQSPDADSAAAATATANGLTAKYQYQQLSTGNPRFVLDLNTMRGMVQQVNNTPIRAPGPAGSDAPSITPQPNQSHHPRPPQLPSQHHIDFNPDSPSLPKRFYADGPDSDPVDASAISLDAEATGRPNPKSVPARCKAWSASTTLPDVPSATPAQTPIASSTTPPDGKGSTKRAREEDFQIVNGPSTASSSTPSTPSPKRAEPEWDGPPSEALQKRAEKVEKIQTDEDSTSLTELLKRDRQYSSPTENIC
ncbi:hypothetical protein BV25DRAFT_1842973, partial [Artomyces pyxidatus]